MPIANGSEVVRCRTLDQIDDKQVGIDISHIEDLEAGACAVDVDAAVDTVVETDADDDAAPSAAGAGDLAAPRGAFVFGVAVVAALFGLVGWLGLHDSRSPQEQVQRSQLLQAARQGALNLTTIDWKHAESDVQRIIDGATGEFHDDFVQRSRPFIDVIKKFQSTSVGTVSEAALETATGDAAQALVAVTVNTANVGESEQEPRSWRLRISVHRVDDQIKVSDVEFVP